MRPVGQQKSDDKERAVSATTLQTPPLYELAGAVGKARSDTGEKACVGHAAGKVQADVAAADT